MKPYSLALICPALWLAAALAPLAAPIADLLPALTAADMAVREAALTDLHKRCTTTDAAERRAVITEITAALPTATNQAAWLLVRQLRMIGGEESVPALAALLPHEDMHLRDDARQALEANDSPAAGKALAAALPKATDPRMAAGIIDSLGRRAEPGTEKLLAPHLASESLEVATAATHGLARMATDDAVAALTQAHAGASGPRAVLLRESIFDAALAARRQGRDSAAVRIYTQLAADGDEAVRAQALTGLIIADPKGAAGRVELALKGDSAAYQLAAIAAVTRTRAADQSAVLARFLPQLPEHLQPAALAALTAARQRAASPQVAALLTSTNALVARAAIRTLGAIGDATSVPALLAAAARPEGAKDVAETLAEIDGPGVNEALLGVVRGKDGPRALALDALLARKVGGLRPELLTLAASADEKMALAALGALKQVGEAADLEALLGVAAAAKSRPVAEASIGAACALAQRSPDPAAVVKKIGQTLAPAGADAKRALLSALAKFGQTAPAPQAAAAWQAMRPLLDQADMAATAAHFLTQLAPTILATDAPAVAETLARIEAAAIPDDVKARARTVAAFEDGWLLNGSIAGPYKGGDPFKKAHPPEEAGAQVEWSALTPEDRSGEGNRTINLGRRIRGNNCVAYLRFVCIRPQAGAAQLELGSDDGVMAWVNGQEVHRNDVSRPCVAGSDKVAISLKQGLNTLLFKIVQREGNFEFTGRVVEPPPPAAPAPAPASN